MLCGAVCTWDEGWREDGVADGDGDLVCARTCVCTPARACRCVHAHVGGCGDTLLCMAAVARKCEYFRKKEKGALEIAGEGWRTSLQKTLVSDQEERGLGSAERE